MEDLPLDEIWTESAVRRPADRFGKALGDLTKRYKRNTPNLFKETGNSYVDSTGRVVEGVIGSMGLRPAVDIAKAPFEYIYDFFS